MVSFWSYIIKPGNFDSTTQAWYSKYYKDKFCKAINKHLLETNSPVHLYLFNYMRVAIRVLP